MASVEGANLRVRRPANKGFLGAWGHFGLALMLAVVFATFDDDFRCPELTFLCGCKKPLRPKSSDPILSTLAP